MTLDVYHGRKTTIQQQQHCRSYTARVTYWPATLHVIIAFGSLYFQNQSVVRPSWTRDGINIVEKVKNASLVVYPHFITFRNNMRFDHITDSNFQTCKLN